MFAQTRSAHEVVVVDDCSPDDTVAVVERAAAGAPVPVRVVRLPRNTGGPSGPLNAGIRVARGDLIAPLDHDDHMLPDKLARQAAVLEGHPSLGLAFHRCLPVGTDGAPFVDDYTRRVADWLAAVPKASLGPDAWRIDRAVAYSGVAELNYAQSCSGLMFPKAVWARVGGFDPRFRTACDLAFLQRVTARWDVGYVDRPLVQWLRHPGSFTFNAAHARGEREYWRVLTRVRPGLLAAGAEPRWRIRRAEQEWDLRVLARSFRRRGLLRQAAAVQWELIRGRPAAAAAAAAKDLVRPLARALGLAARPSPAGGG